MRWLLLLCLLAFVGCNSLTEDQARAICDSAGASDASFNEAVSLAQEDEADGLTAAESMDLFVGDCEDVCSNGSATCITDCTTCTDAVVIFVYSN